MVRAAALICLLMLTACDRLQSQTGSDRLIDLTQRSAEQSIQLVELRAQIADLKREQQLDKAYLQAVAASLEEARDNHTALRKTFNENVDLDNARNKAIRAHLDRLDTRLGI